VSVDSKGQETHLVPELCRLTDITEELLDDYKTARDIRSVTHTDSQVKVKECLKLFERFHLK